MYIEPRLEPSLNILYGRQRDLIRKYLTLNGLSFPIRGVTNYNKLPDLTKGSDNVPVSQNSPSIESYDCVFDFCFPKFVIVKLAEFIFPEIAPKLVGLIIWDTSSDNAQRNMS